MTNILQSIRVSANAAAADYSTVYSSIWNGRTDHFTVEQVDKSYVVSFSQPAARQQEFVEWFRERRVKLHYCRYSGYVALCGRDYAMLAKLIFGGTQ